MNFQVPCPGCKLSIPVAVSSQELVKIDCPECGKHFAARMPKNSPKTKSVAKSVPLAGESSGLLDQLTLPPVSMSAAQSPADWNARPAGFPVQRGPILLTLSIVGALIGVAGIVYLLMVVKWDLSSFGFGRQEATGDSYAQLQIDWQSCVDEQERLFATIERKSDCNVLVGRYQSLTNRQTDLVVRAAMLGLPQETSEPNFSTTALPAYHDEGEETNKKFRKIDTLLTPDFRIAEQQLQRVSDTVLRYLHIGTQPLAPAQSGRDKAQVEAIQLSLRLLAALAGLSDEANQEQVAVSIYELATEQSALADRLTETIGHDAPSRSEYRPVIQLIAAMRGVLTKNFATEEKPTLANALAVYDQAAQRVDLALDASGSPALRSATKE